MGWWSDSPRHGLVFFNFAPTRCSSFLFLDTARRSRSKIIAGSRGAQPPWRVQGRALVGSGAKPRKRGTQGERRITPRSVFSGTPSPDVPTGSALPQPPPRGMIPPRPPQFKKSGRAAHYLQKLDGCGYAAQCQRGKNLNIE